MEVIRNQEFLLLPAEELHKLLASDDVNVPDEETIFHALMMWVKYDMQRRCNDLSMLLAYIRLPLLPPQVFLKLCNHHHRHHHHHKNKNIIVIVFLCKLSSVYNLQLLSILCI